MVWVEQRKCHLTKSLVPSRKESRISGISGARPKWSNAFPTGSLTVWWRPKDSIHINARSSVTIPMIRSNFSPIISTTRRQNFDSEKIQPQVKPQRLSWKNGISRNLVKRENSRWQYVVTFPRSSLCLWMSSMMFQGDDDVREPRTSSTHLHQSIGKQVTVWIYLKAAAVD